MVKKKQKLNAQNKKENSDRNEIPIKTKLEKSNVKNDDYIRKKREDKLIKHAQPFMF